VTSRVARTVPSAARLAPFAVVLLAVAFFCWTGFTALDRPGLEYDETGFVNVALGANHPDQFFVHGRFLGVPTKVFPYIGALKSWLFAPIFAVADVTPESIRAPSLLLGLLAVALAVLLAWRLLGPWPAALLAVVLATDPTFVTMSKADWGPIVLAALLRVGALLAYFALLRTRRLRWTWVLAALLVLGIFNKVDFLWFVAGLGAAALVVHGRDLLALARARPVAAALPVAAFLLALGVLAVESILPASELPLQTPSDSVSERLTRRWWLFRDTFDGRAVLGFMSSDPIDSVTPAPWLYVAAAGGALIAAASTVFSRIRVPREEGRLAAFFLIQLVVILILFVATRQVGGPQHAIQLWPIPQLVAVTVLAFAARLPSRGMRMAGAAVIGAALVWLVVSQASVSREYANEFAHGHSFTTVWTPEIYDMARTAGRLGTSVDGVVAADWGIGPQVFALNGDAVRDRFRDLPPSFAGGARGTEAQIASDVFAGRRVLVMFHREDAEVFDGSTLGVRRVIRALGPHARVRDVYDGAVLRASVVDDR
jgi:4-amino-4-deoxy-L-arabinose transferase-like glycosyltransferase